MKNDARNIRIVSDCGHYEIIASLVSAQDCYTIDNFSGRKSYKGSYWICDMRKDGKSTDYIMSVDKLFCVHLGEYGNGLCPYNMGLNKNTILFAAFMTGRFEKALSKVDFMKVQRQYWKEYRKARIEYGMAGNPLT